MMNVNVAFRLEFIVADSPSLAGVVEGETGSFSDYIAAADSGIAVFPNLGCFV